MTGPEDAIPYSTEPSGARVAVIGAGILGTMSALTLKEIYPDVAIDVFDSLPPNAEHGNASYAAAAQFLPIVGGEVRLRKCLVPLETAYGRMAVAGFAQSKKFYEELSLEPETTGVMKTTLVELTNSQQRWPAYLEFLMQPELHSLEDEGQPPIEVEDADGKADVYTHYYLCSESNGKDNRTFTIDTIRTLHYLQDRLREKPDVQWHYDTTITDLNTFDYPTIIATGIDEPGKPTGSTGYLASIGYPIQSKKRGMTGRFCSPDPLSPVMISFGDFVVAPHGDLHSFNAGGLALPYEMSSANREKAQESIVRRAKEIGKKVVGPWRGLPDGALEQPVSFNTGVRSTHMGGLQASQDFNKPCHLLVEAGSSVGWSLAPAIGAAAATYAGRVSRKYQRGERGEELLGDQWLGYEHLPRHGYNYQLDADIWHGEELGDFEYWQATRG